MEEMQEPFLPEISKEINLLLMEVGKETNGFPVEIIQLTTNLPQKLSLHPPLTSTLPISI